MNRREEIIKGLESLIDNKLSFLAPDDYEDEDNIFLQDVRVLREAIYIIEELEELENINEHLDIKLKDIKFGTGLQSDIITAVLKFVEINGVRFEVLDVPETAEKLAKDFGHDIELANQIGDILISNFDY